MINVLYVNYISIKILMLLQVNALCVDCFPVEYPRSWYEDITSNPKFYSLAAIHKSTIVGIIVAEIKLYIKLTPKVKFILNIF